MWQKLFADNFLKSQPTIHYGILCAIRQPSIKCLHHVHQALKNNRSVGWNNFFHFFYIFNFFIPGPGDIPKENVNKGLFSSMELFMDSKLQTDLRKKRWAKISNSLKFLLAQIFVTLAKFCHSGSTSILGWQKFELFHIEIKFVYFL